MELFELVPKRGSRKKAKRRGCGTGSGHGKTSGRGHKGQKSRAGRKPRLGFEGGQMPLIRRIPKRGFTNQFKKEFQIVNIESLNSFADQSSVTVESLIEKRLINKNKIPVKVLGKGELKKKLEVKAHCFSKSAISKIETAGGSIKVVK